MDITLKSLTGDVNYWVVRAGKGGEFLDHFLDAKIASISHLNKLEYSKIDLSKDGLETTLASLKNILKDEKKSSNTITSITTQIRKFVTDIKIGDVIISVDDKRMVAGTVVSDVYVDTVNVNRYSIENKLIGNSLDHLVRREIKWDRVQQKKNVPQSVKTSLKANQTVFCVSNHWRTLNHWLSVIFEKDDSIYFSTRIETENPIHNLDINEYTTALIQAEAFATYLAQEVGLDNIPTDEDELRKCILKHYRKMKCERTFQITTQQSFMSPGDYWGELKGSPLTRLIFVSVLASLLNVNVVYASDNYPADIAKINTIATTASAIIDKENNLTLVKKNLSIRVPKPASKSSQAEIKFPDDEADKFIGQ